MSEEGASHTLNVAQTHTGGPMQLQASTDSEEKKVST